MSLMMMIVSILNRPTLKMNSYFMINGVEGLNNYGGGHHHSDCLNRNTKVVIIFELRNSFSK
jgi:hypothetical protein